MTNIECNLFNEKYCSLSELERTIFKNLTIQLLKLNFILRVNNKDSYEFLIKHSELMKLFFSFINFDFIIKESKELVYIKSCDDSALMRVNKNETIALLVLRLIYQEHLEEVRLDDEINVTVKELQDKLFAISFKEMTNDRVKKSTLNDMLRIFKQHNIIYYKEKDLYLEDTLITIYPSIEVVMDFKQINEIVTRLDSLVKVDEVYD